MCGQRRARVGRCVGGGCSDRRVAGRGRCLAGITGAAGARSRPAGSGMAPVGAQGSACRARVGGCGGGRGGPEGAPAPGRPDRDGGRVPAMCEAADALIEAPVRATAGARGGRCV